MTYSSCSPCIAKTKLTFYIIPILQEGREPPSKTLEKFKVPPLSSSQRPLIWFPVAKILIICEKYVRVSLFLETLCSIHINKADVKVKNPFFA